MEMIMQTKFKVGDKVRYCNKLGLQELLEVGDTFEVVATCVDHGSILLRAISSAHRPFGSYSEKHFELVEPNPVLTPEEVFEHLRKGTKLQWRYKGSNYWQDCVHSGNVQVRCILDSDWRIKPEPEVIELNGKRYKLIEE